MATNPTRFVGLGTLPMNAPTLAVEEIKRAVTDLKFLASHKDSAHIEISFERCSFTPFILLQL